MKILTQHIYDTVQAMEAGHTCPTDIAGVLKISNAAASSRLFEMCKAGIAKRTEMIGKRQHFEYIGGEYRVYSHADPVIINPAFFEIVGLIRGGINRFKELNNACTVANASSAIYGLRDHGLITLHKDDGNYYKYTGKPYVKGKPLNGHRRKGEYANYKTCDVFARLPAKPGNASHKMPMWGMAA